MIVLSLFSWWYGDGWSGQVHRAGKRIAAIMDLFSVGLLLKTLFDPFRQIDAQPKAGPRRQALLDQLFSRGMGFIVRSFTILFGLFAACGAALLGLLQVVLWPLAPVTPLIGIVMMLIGVAI